MDIPVTWKQYLESALEFIPKLITALVMFGAALLSSGVVARWARRAAGKNIDNPETLQLISRLARWAVIVGGTLISLDLVNFDITGFVATLGIAGFTIGFALQDIARNFIAGVLLLIRQPFSIGDIVEIADYTGTVTEITTRDTVIKTFDGEIVILPNLDVFSNAIINYSGLTLRRRTVRIGLGYQEDVERAARLFLDAIGSVEGVVREPAPTILAEELGDSALILSARFWVNQETHNLLETHSMAVQMIKRVSEEEEIDLPYPIQTFRLEGSLPIITTGS